MFHWEMAHESSGVGNPIRVGQSSSLGSATTVFGRGAADDRAAALVVANLVGSGLRLPRSGGGGFGAGLGVVESD